MKEGYKMKESSKRRIVHSPLQLNPALDSECQRLEDLLMRRDGCERQISRTVNRLMAIEQLLDQLQAEDPDLALHAEVERVLYQHEPG